MNNHILYGPAPQIIFAPAGCVVIDNLTNWDELLPVVGGKVLLPALLFLQLALIPLPDRHVYVQTATPINRYDKIDFMKSITKSFMKSITKSFTKTITQSIFEQEIAFWVCP